MRPVLHLERPDLRVLVISRRDAEATRAKAESLGLTYPIVMQKQWELSLKYGMFATPIGYLIDEQGVLPGHCARAWVELVTSRPIDVSSLGDSIAAIPGLGRRRLGLYLDALVRLAIVCLKTIAHVVDRPVPASVRSLVGDGRLGVLPVRLIAQLLGASLVLPGLLSSFAAGMTDVGARRSVVISLFVFQVIGFAVSLLGMLSKVMSVAGWAVVGLFLIFALGYTYFLFMKQSEM